jgi:hypothetical protein
MHHTSFVFLLILILATSGLKGAILNFGSSWPGAFTTAGEGAYSSDPYNRLKAAASGGGFSNGTQIATLLSEVSGGEYKSTDIYKNDAPVELGGSDGYFAVTPGWEWLIVQYNGPNGGSAVIQLGGHGALVPFDSSPLWGGGDQYAVSHFSLAGPMTEPPGGGQLPEAGTAVYVFGSVLALAMYRRR